MESFSASSYLHNLLQSYCSPITFLFLSVLSCIKAAKRVALRQPFLEWVDNAKQHNGNKIFPFSLFFLPWTMLGTAVPHSTCHHSFRMTTHCITQSAKDCLAFVYANVQAPLISAWVKGTLWCLHLRYKGPCPSTACCCLWGSIVIKGLHNIEEILIAGHQGNTVTDIIG